jgi:hypothetical protein
VTQNDEQPVERKKSPWWPPTGETIVAFAALIASGTLIVLRGYYPESMHGLPTLVGGGMVILATVLVLIRIGQRYEWTGFGESSYPKSDSQEIQPRKTLWDWLQLCIVPVVLAGFGYMFTVQQDARQQQIEDKRAQQAQKIENQRAEAERELAVQRAQDEALQAYLDQMSGLLLERNLRASEENSEVRTLARVRTLTVLERLDPGRKTAVMQFLVEANLVQRVDGRDPIISLMGSDLSEANLLFADLSEADLSGANLRRARGVTNEELEQPAASLEGATMPDGQKYEDWLKDREKSQQDE